MTDDQSELDQKSIALKAMRIKERGAKPADYPTADDEANMGMHSIPRPDYPPSGAFDAEGQRPVLERSRKER